MSKPEDSDMLNADSDFVCTISPESDDSDEKLSDAEKPPAAWYPSNKWWNPVVKYPDK